MQNVVILSGCRTPIGKFLGELSPLSAPQLGATAVREAVRRGDIVPDCVDEVIVGNVLTAGVGQAPARQAALAAGLPVNIAALTINKVCGSGMKAVMLAAQAIQVGEARVIVAGGMESMSRAPHLVTGARVGWKLGEQKVVDSILSDGLICAFDGSHMGNQAERTARAEEITREAQDEYASESHHRAVAATQAGLFGPEIVPVEVKSRDGIKLVSQDQCPRSDANVAGLAALSPVFEACGTVTAGNASPLSDGAAMLLVAEERFAIKNGRKPLVRILAYATAGVEPKNVLYAPIDAVKAVLKKACLNVADIDLWEINEAFAAQTLACMHSLDVPHEKLNVHGGAIALGHPLGASGARVLVTLVSAMRLRRARRGLAALCLGGGNAVAMILENYE